MTSKMHPRYTSLVATLLKQQLRLCSTAFFAFVGALAVILAPSVTHAQQSALTCSMTNVPMTNDPGSGTDNSVLNGFTVTPGSTGLAGWSVLTNTPANVVDNNLTNYATGTTVALGSITLDVRDNAGNQYNAGNFVGFNISTVLDLSVLGDITISTLDVNGDPIESRSGAGLLSLDLGGGASDIGFYTNQSFYGVRLNIAAVINVGSYNVYYAFVRGTGSCTSPALTCNTPTMLSFPAQPVVAENSTEAVLALGGVTNLGNMVDNDPGSAATMVPVAGVLGSHGVSVKNTTGQYPAGTYIGFDIENTSIISANLFGRYSIELYNDDGTVQQTISGADALAGVNAINSTRRMFGGVATVAFDEARLVFNSAGLGDVNLGATNIYGVYVTNLCGNTLDCDQTYSLTNPGFPVIINSQRTGFAGVASVNGEVENPEFVIDNIPGNYGTVEVDAGAASSGSISVLDTKNEYPAGTYVGFNVAKGTSGGILDFVADAGVLGTITIETWNNGSLAESETISTGLVDLSALDGLIAIGSGTLFTSVGFQATQPFDEAVIKISSLAGVANQLRVFGAFAVTTSIPGICTSLPVSFGSVSAEFKDGALFVNWQTLSETGNKEFIVQGSKDGKNWVAIGTVVSKAADGNSDVTLEYNFTKSLSDIALGGLGIIALLSIPLFRNRFVKGCLAVAFLIMMGVSCNKNNEGIALDDAENLYIRIAQVDKDGKISYSKTVKTIVK